MVIGPIALVGLAAWLASWSGPDTAGRSLEAFGVLLGAAPWAIAWLAAAFGFGRLVRPLAQAGGADGLAIQAAAGAAVLLWLDAVLGSLGILEGVGAWVVLLAGIALAADQWWRRPRRSDRSLPLLPWETWVAAPAVAVLLVAACSAPGWLWESEFGGYDAMSYHLQLPGEWLASGRIEPLSHNVYSYLPGYVEAAYYHLAVAIGDGVAAVYACQLLHAGFTLLTAAVVWRLAARRCGRRAGALAAAVMLGTPWVVVVGSLGYNEMAVTLFLAAGLLVLDQDPVRSPGRGVLVGLLAAAACGAKLTAVGFVAAPLGVLLILTAPPGHRVRQAAAAAGAAAAFLSPWLLRNWANGGNPVFPFATGVLGTGHWTAEQAVTWRRGHLGDLGVGRRLGEGWTQLLRYGFGPSPEPAQPWLPQWSLLPWLVVAGLLIGALGRLRAQILRPALVLLMQVLFWLSFTHIKSRFMLPAVVPAALLVATVVADLTARAATTATRNALTGAVVLATLAWCCLPVVLFGRERGGAPAAMIAATGALTGDALRAGERRLMAEVLPAVYLNHDVAPGSRTLLIGEARPLYYRGDVSYQTTWDRGPLSRAMRAEPEAPQRWLRALREAGYSHLLINTEMLERWAAAGWNDPLITAPRVVGAVETHAVLERDFDLGTKLYRLK